MRILVAGANGQVGHELLRAFGFVGGPEGPTGSRLPPLLPPLLLQGSGHSPPRADAVPVDEIIPATRSGRLDDGTPCERVDLADLDGLLKALNRIAPDLVINAAAYTAVDRAEDEPDLAQRSNGDAVGVLGAWAAQHAARVVHYSTDYVFDGTGTRPYREDAAAHPLGVYGRSKLAGEIALRDSGSRHLILRTAWVYAARGRNFLLTMLRLGAERDELRVVDDQIGVPTSARLIADVTAHVVAQWCDDAAASRDGTYHLAASGQTSWCGFARAIFERTTPAGLLVDGGDGHPPQSPFLRKGDAMHPLPQDEAAVHGQELRGRAPRGGMLSRAPRVIAITTADYPTRAKRPAYSVLDTTKLRESFKVELPDWQTALDGVIDEMTAPRS